MPDNSFVLITNGNTMSMIALADWLSRYGQHLLKVYVTYRLPSTRGNLRGVLSMLRHSGWSYTYLKIWANKILPMRLRKKGLPANVAEFIDLCGLDSVVEPVASVNTEEVVSEIRELAPDYLVSFSATQRFKEPLIDSLAKAAINTHYGALPAYAGLSPYYWHLHNRERQFGVTLHHIIPKLDAGPIIEQVIDNMADAKTALEVLLRMAACVSPMLNRFFDSPVSVQQSNPQPSEGRSYFGHPTKEQVREFRTSGLAMMDGASKAKVFESITQLAQLARDRRNQSSSPYGADRPTRASSRS